MTTTEDTLNAALDRSLIIPLQVSPKAPLPASNASYDPIRDLEQTGLEITIRELLHAIGSKTANLPSSKRDDCLRASLLYTYILDLDQQHLSFKPYPDSDLKTPRSQEVGIGMTCLLANKAFGIPWDQLGNLPGPGLRFDYRGQVNGFDGIFESKGTSHRSNQSGQLNHGLEKKEAHHNRGDQFDVELIISTFVGRGTEQPRIVVGDPDFDKLAEIYKQADSRFFRLRHYVRILQFIGLPEVAYNLNRYALIYLKGESSLGWTGQSQSQITTPLETEVFNGKGYIGQWFEDVAPKQSKRYKEDRYGNVLLDRFGGKKKRRVFQGLREDIFSTGFESEPFSQELLTKSEIASETEDLEVSASLFPDGTIQLFRQD